MEQSESIRELTQSIEKGTISLPEFQRDFVWDITKTYDLFDSIIRGIFIGAIIYGKPSFEIAVREVDDRPRKGQGKNRKLKIEKFTREQIANKVKVDNYRIVLDGQQRATSLFRAFTGIDEVWFIAKNDSDYDESEVLDKNISEQTLEEIIYEISGSQDNERISVKLSDVYSIMQENWRESKIEKEVFQKQSYQGDDEEGYEYNLEKYLTICDKLQDIFKESKLLNYYLLDMDVDKFALFFERSNSKGINLKFTDILAAKLYAGDFNLRHKIDEFKENNPNFANNFNQEIVVRTLAYIIGDGREKIDKSYILKKLNHEHFTKYWDKICGWYKETLNFLFDNHYIVSQSWMPYENMIIPLMIFRWELDKDFSQMSEKHSEFIQYWYWASIFSQRYTGSSNEMIIKDANYLRKLAKGERILEKAYFNRLARLQINSKDDFYDYNRKASALYKGILNLINFYSKGLVSWENNNKLNFNDNRLEDHHIFPKNYIKKRFKDDLEAQDKMSSAINRTLIPKISNILISDKAPSKYLKEIEAKNSSLRSSLDKHLIPLEIMDMDELFLEILDERATKLFDILQTMLVDKHTYILQNHYKERENQKGNIKIFGFYLNEEVEASFDLETSEVIYKNEIYSPSGAASKFKEEISGQSRSTNGWDFWKYRDEENEIKLLKELKN